MSARPAPSTRIALTVRRTLPRPALAVLAALAVATALLSGTGPGSERPRLTLTSANPVTPGNFTGYAFDQCTAPSQHAMTAWLRHSPYLGAGIYISGDSRGCRSQPNLSPAWVHTQLSRGWKLLPITLGPQASCNPKFPRYGNDETINPTPGSNHWYGRARTQGRNEAAKTVDAAGALGISKHSTLWYDIEAFDIGRTDCRESALAFLSAWTNQMHKLGYDSGVYSSAGSGIKMLDDVRRNRPKAYTLPDMIWIARWDGKANTSTSYISEDGWRPGRRVKQYLGGHDESWGGVRINVDRDYLHTGRGSWAPRETHCGGVRVNFKTYPSLGPRTATFTSSPSRVSALQCLMKERGYYDGTINGHYTKATIAAMHAWKTKRGFSRADHGIFARRAWVAFLSPGPRPVLKYGSAGDAVRRLQRTLNAADPRLRLPVHGVFNGPTKHAVIAYQKRKGIRTDGIVTGPTWNAVYAGRY